MVEGLRAHGLHATPIGVITESRDKLLIHADGHTETVDQLGRDELYRVLEERP